MTMLLFIRCFSIDFAFCLFGCIELCFLFFFIKMINVLTCVGFPCISIEKLMWNMIIGTCVVNACNIVCSTICGYMCVYVGSRVTMWGDGILRAWRGGVLCAVSTRILQGVTAALLLLHTQTTCQNHGKLTSCWHHWFPMLEEEKKEGDERQGYIFFHKDSYRVRKSCLDSYFLCTLILMFGGFTLVL